MSDFEYTFLPHQVLLGDDSHSVPPESISNSEVKGMRADDSVGFPHVKVGYRQVLFFINSMKFFNNKYSLFFFRTLSSHLVLLAASAFLGHIDKVRSNNLSRDQMLPELDESHTSVVNPSENELPDNHLFCG